MTTQDIETNVTDTNQDIDGTEGGSPKELRDYAARLKEENAGLRTQLMVQAYEDAGLDPAIGIGKAISKEYDGEPTSEALLAYAESEYGHKPAETPENPKQPVIDAEQRKLDEANQSSDSALPTTNAEQERKHQADGNLVAAGAVKAQRLRDMYAQRNKG